MKRARVQDDIWRVKETELSEQGVKVRLEKEGEYEAVGYGYLSIMIPFTEYLDKYKLGARFAVTIEELR